MSSIFELPPLAELSRSELVDEVVDLRVLVSSAETHHNQFGDGSCKKSCAACAWRRKLMEYFGERAIPSKTQVEFLAGLPGHHSRNLRGDLAWLEPLGWISCSPILGAREDDYSITEAGIRALRRSPTAWAKITEQGDALAKALREGAES